MKHIKGDYANVGGLMVYDEGLVEDGQDGWTDWEDEWGDSIDSYLSTGEEE